MGGTKRMMEEQQAEYDAALEICLAADAIEECESHPGTYFQGSESVEDALEHAETDEERETIRSVYEDNSGVDYCTSCAMNLRD